MSETAPIRETVGCSSAKCPCCCCREKRGDPIHETEDDCIAAGDHFKRICADGYCTMCGVYYDGDETSVEEEEEKVEVAVVAEPTRSKDDLITSTFWTAVSVLISRDANRRRAVYVNTELLEEIEKEFRRIRSKLSDAQADLLVELISCDMPTFLQTQSTMGPREKEVARSVATGEHETTVSVIRSLCRLLERRRKGVPPTAQSELELSRSYQIFSLEDLSSRLTYKCFQLSTFVNTQVKLALDTVPAFTSDRPYLFAWVKVTGLWEGDGTDELVGDVISANPRLELDIGQTISFTRGEVLDTFIEGRPTCTGVDPQHMEDQRYDYVSGLNTVLDFPSTSHVCLSTKEARSLWQRLSDQEKLNVEYAERYITRLRESQTVEVPEVV